MRQDKLLEFWFAQLDGNYFVDRLFSLFCGLTQVYFCPVMISYYGSDPNHYRLHLIFQNLQPVLLVFIGFSIIPKVIAALGMSITETTAFVITSITVIAVSAVF